VTEAGAWSKKCSEPGPQHTSLSKGSPKAQAFRFCTVVSAMLRSASLVRKAEWGVMRTCAQGQCRTVASATLQLHAG
jgi:hypothetical protein